MKAEKNRKYYHKCSNNFAADCNPRDRLSVNSFCITLNSGKMLTKEVSYDACWVYVPPSDTTFMIQESVIDLHPSWTICSLTEYFWISASLNFPETVWISYISWFRLRAVKRLWAGGWWSNWFCIVKVYLIIFWEKIMHKCLY